MCFLSFSFWNVSNAAKRPFYMGLTVDPEAHRCHCQSGDTAAICRQCQETWMWTDGKPMEYLFWADENQIDPAEGEECGLFLPSGWIAKDCSSRHRYLCKKTVCC